MNAPFELPAALLPGEIIVDSFAVAAKPIIRRARPSRAVPLLQAAE